MKIKSAWQVLAILSLFLSPLACSLPGQSPALVATNPPPGNVETFAVQLTQTALARGGDSATRTPAPPEPGEPTFTPTFTPTITLTPTLSDTPTLTVTPSLTYTPTKTVDPTPCNAAQFVSDVTYPDDTEVGTNDSFVKTWKLQNTGTCAWTSGYKVIFDHGDQMGAPASASFTGGSVAPGATVNISVSLKAPGTEGTYKGYFKLKSPDGQIFGIGGSATSPFWVQIKAVSSAVHLFPVVPLNPIVLKPDLLISSISLNPNPPKADINTHVKVKVNNGGGNSTHAFTVRWWGLETFANPSCTWNVPSLAAGASKTLECDFIYASGYINLKTKATADTANTNNEFDEGNNTKKVAITVNN